MRQIVMNLDSRDRYLLYQEVIRQGENLGAEIVVNLNAEFAGYRYLMRLKLNNNATVPTAELPVVNNQVKYPIPALFTAQAGELKIVFEAFEQISEGNIRVVKSATTILKVTESLDGGTEIMPEPYVPWYLEAVEAAAEASISAEEATDQATIATTQAGIATTKAQEAAQSVVDASTAGEEAARAIIDDTILKVSSLEKSFSNFQQALASVNANQEAKQTVSGYEVLSLPKNAANGIANAGLKGMTLKNELNYNPETWVEWTKSAGVVGDSKGIEFTFNEYVNVWAYCNTLLKGNTKYLILLNVLTNTLTTRRLQLSNNLTDNYINVVNPGEIGNRKILITTKETINTNTIRFTQSSSGDIDLKVKITNVKVFELPTGSEIETDANTMTADQLAIKYPYIQGGEYRSVPCAGRFKGVGKNLFDKKWELGTINSDMGQDASNVSEKRTVGYIRVNTGDALTISRNVYDGAVGFRFYDINKNYIGTGNISMGSALNYTFTVPTNASYLRLKVISTDLTTIYRLDRGTSVGSEPYTESTQYLLATESDGQIAELRSIPSAKDEIKDGQRIGRNKKIILNGSENWIVWNGTIQQEKTLAFSLINITTDSAKNVIPISNNFKGFTNASNLDVVDENGIAISNSIYMRIEKTRLVSPDIVGLKAWLQNNPTTLIYQLESPVITPVQVSGTLLTCPSGTVMWEPAVADAGIYNNGISVLHQDLPIQSIERIAKVDFMTGVETELDVSTAVIATDKKSFTHPSLANNDIIFFTYFYESYTPNPEMSVEYYDSRYVLKDSVTGKYYKVVQTVANGVLSQTLVEV